MSIIKQSNTQIKTQRVMIVAVFAVMMTSAAYASAPNLYIAQGGATGASGSSCVSALPVSFFNNSANWGSGGAQIGPGTTVHLCGIFTAGAGTSGLLQFQGGGTQGNPVTLLFESGAILTAPYWGDGAITAAGFNYIVVDGGTNGIIQATQNGTALSNQADGRGIAFDVVSNSEIRNLTFSNLYVHTVNTSDEGGQQTYALFWNGGNNITIDNNTCHDVRTCFLYGYAGSATSSGVNIYSNNVYSTNWGIIVGDGNTNAILNAPVTIHDNIVHDFVMWDDVADNNHHDGIDCFTAHVGSVLNACSIYNNYIYGDPGVHTTAFIFDSQNTGGAGCNGVQIFNNVVVNSSTTNFPDNGLILDWCTGTFIANNTIIGSTSANNYSTGIMIDPGLNATITNNSFSNFNMAIYLNNAGVGSIAAADNNNYYNVAVIGADNAGHYYYTLADWIGCTQDGCPAVHDQHSKTGAPNLSAQFIPQAGSSLIQGGANLTSLAITVLDSDKAGTQRPATGAWDIGAYASGSTTGTAISVTLTPPTISLAAGAQQPFTATVTGAPSGTSTGVTWTLNPSVGTVSATGLYTAPASITAQQTVQITATAVADASKSATSTITLTPPPATTSGISLSISPTTMTLAPGGQQQFVANLTGSSTGVKWSLSPLVGTLSTAGLYKAPATLATQQTVTITATSKADSTKTASATVTITPSPAVCSAAVSGTKSVITGPGGVQLTISLARGTSGTVTWTPQGAQCP